LGGVPFPGRRRRRQMARKDSGLKDPLPGDILQSWSRGYLAALAAVQRDTGESQYSGSLSVQSQKNAWIPECAGKSETLVDKFRTFWVCSRGFISQAVETSSAAASIMVNLLLGGVFLISTRPG
jgi:hypothetical protein